jgi:hypothetical protein
MLDEQLQKSLASIPDGLDKTGGITIGKTVADEILALRSNDGSGASPIPFVFTNPPASGAYQSTPPNFPKQPQFTHWSQVTPFALERANQFRPGPPPSLTGDVYTDAFNEVKSLGIAGSTTATQEQALTVFRHGTYQRARHSRRARRGPHRNREAGAPRNTPGHTGWRCDGHVWRIRDDAVLSHPRHRLERIGSLPVWSVAN